MTERQADQCVRELFLTWYPTALRCAYRLCNSLEAAEDTVQEAFRELFLALLAGVHVNNAKAWTYQVIRREIARNYKEQLRRAECLEPGDVMDQRPAVAAEQGPLSDDELSRLLSGLTPREEEVVLLRIQGFRYQEIASTLHISINSVKTLLARALRRLQGTAGEEPKLPRGFRKFKKYVTRTLF